MAKSRLHMLLAMLVVQARETTPAAVSKRGVMKFRVCKVDIGYRGWQNRVDKINVIK